MTHSTHYKPTAINYARSRSVFPRAFQWHPLCTATVTKFQIESHTRLFTSEPRHTGEKALVSRAPDHESHVAWRWLLWRVCVGCVGAMFHSNVRHGLLHVFIYLFSLHVSCKNCVPQTQSDMPFAFRVSFYSLTGNARAENRFAIISFEFSSREMPLLHSCDVRK